MFAHKGKIYQWNTNEALEVIGELPEGYAHFSVDDMYFVSHRESVTATVDEDTILTKFGAYDQEATFTYDTSGTTATWKLNGLAVTLSDYGISVTGTPANNDYICITISQMCSMPVVDKKVSIPDKILTSERGFEVFYYVQENGAKTLSRQFFEVEGRVKPNGYVYQPTTYVSYVTLQEFVDLARKFKNVSASATTLEAGQSATATYTEGATGVSFAFGLPRGAAGPQGPAGQNGRIADVLVNDVSVVGEDNIAYIENDTSEFAKLESDNEFNGSNTFGGITTFEDATEFQGDVTMSTELSAYEINAESISVDSKPVATQEYVNSHVPTKTSELTNDSGFITSAYHDSTKADVSTTYTKTDVDTRLNAKQDTLVSATNIKTINNQSILGSGNIDIQGGGGTTTWGNIGGTLSNQTDLTEIVSSNNLFNNADTDIKPNVYINGSGREVSDANYITTGFIPVTALSYYKWWSSSSGGSVFTSKSVRVASYGEDKTFISATSSSDAANGYQAASGAKYIRISYTRNFPDNLMCCIATYTPTTYEAYISKTIINKTLVYVDDSVNSTSTNPIQNKVIKEYVDSKPYLNPHGCNLPDTIYAFANYEIDLHLRNIYNYEDGDALTRARVTVSGGGNFGKLDSKKLSYTPTSAETKLAQIYNFDHNYNALNSDVKTISVVNASTKSSLKTLVIGDSFVYGGKMTLQMLENAEEDNYDLTLLGTRGSSTNQHEGRSGWTALQYCTTESTNAFYNPSLTTTSKFDFSYYMTNQGYSGVDCVFINLGTNDLFSTRTDTERTNAINTWLANLDNMVNSIHAYDSNIKIIINPPIPSSRDEDTWGEIYAAANPPVFQMTWLFSRATHEGGIKLREHYANASNVYVGWTNASIDTANMVGDVHPTETGYRQIGNAMYSIMRAIN